MSDLVAWKAAVRQLVADLATVFEDRMGYPYGENYVSEPTTVPAGLHPALAAFYGEVGDVWLPDVANGYFIHPTPWLAQAADRGLPTSVEAGGIGAVTTFGSDGGGGLFALALGDGRVFHLSQQDVPVPVGADLDDFLDRLLAAVRAFVDSGAVKEL